jgi:8-amino-7-oxononanoate synthase
MDETPRIEVDRLAWLAADLAEREARGLLRRLRRARPLADGYVELDGKRLLDLAGNDYLGLARD